MSLRFFSNFIIKTKTPCVNCKNYVKYKHATLYDEIYDWEPKLGICSKFGKQNLVTGVIEYDSALLCRRNESKCGKEGRYYEDKYNILS
jgi:hypothetical protein